jgi:hypothetical protein
MRELAQWLTSPARAPQPIADKTVLPGRYKIDLRISTSLAADKQDTPRIRRSKRRLPNSACVWRNT